MSNTENTQEITTEVQATETQTAENNYTEAEQRAIEKGWKPKEEYNGDVATWKSAETFLALEDPIRRIETQSSELKSLRKLVKELQEDNSNVKATEFKRALDFLKTEKKNAMREQEFDKVAELDEKIDIIREKETEFKQEKKNKLEAEEDTNEQLDPRLVSWVNKNNWYKQYPDMKVWADIRGRNLHLSGNSAEKILEILEQEAREEFPRRFSNPNRDRPSNVSNSSRSGSKDSVKLSDVEQRMMEKFVASGAITKEEFLAGMKK